jgi:hypothetical protein
MKIPAHYQKQKLEALMKDINQCHELYVKREFAFERSFRLLLDEARAYYKLIAAHQKETEVCKLLSYYVTALKGINPQTLEKVSKGRRENAWIGAFHALNVLSELLQADFGANEERIEAASEIVNQIMLAALQSNLIEDKGLEKLKDLKAIEHLWADLKKHPSFKIAYQKLKVNVNEHDIYLITDEMIQQIT